jgi:signal transduction histidine kinase
LKEELEQKNGAIENHLVGEVDVIPFQFRQLIYNLVSNSIRFSRSNIPLQIKITGKIGKGETFNISKLAAEREYYHIGITDNGIGFEQQYGEKIFEVFQRLHGRSEYAGTGIGLAIVKKIVENHHGIITATGERNKGATFDVYIPIMN